MRILDELTIPADADAAMAVGLLRARLALERIDAEHAYALLSNMTGDLAHIVAALNLKDRNGRRLGVVVIRREPLNDASDAMRRDLVAARFTDDVALLLTSQLQKEAAKNFYTAACPRENTGPVRPPSQATKDASQSVKAMHVASPMRESWNELLFTAGGQAKPLLHAIERFCHEKGLRPETRLACLWTRHSGARSERNPFGGANPQFDSSPVGMTQICQRLSMPCTKLLIGEGCEPIAAAAQRGDVLALGKYWTEPPFAPLTRMEGNVLFHFLLKVWRCPIVHVGMKSGQMDTLVLWGQPVVFIEDAASATRDRSGRWATLRQAAPLIPPPARKPKPTLQYGAMVQRLPTRLGQALREARTGTSVTEDEWPRVDDLLGRIPDTAEGFTDPDLQLIEEAMQEAIARALSYVAALASQTLRDSQRQLNGGDGKADE